MAKDFNNRLITPELEKAMQDYPLYSQDSKKKDAVCIAVFFIGNARWYILEGQQENDDFVLFGIVVGLAETEYSYISANEMASVELDATKFGLGKVRVGRESHSNHVSFQKSSTESCSLSSADFTIENIFLGG